MRDQLVQYVQLLFAGAENCEDIKQEILQNTLDRYDDLIAAGKVPEAAYRLAISGIGDINEILGTAVQTVPAKVVSSADASENDTQKKRLMRAIAVGLYILCPLPLFILSEIGLEVIGLCGLLVIVAVATVLIILGAKKEVARPEPEDTPQSQLQNSINNIIWTIGLIVYFVISFTTQAWFITWLVFPIIRSVQGLTKAILDLKEAMKNEA